MGWTSYYAPTKTNKECCFDYLKQSSSTVKRTAMKGNTFFALMTNKDGIDWILVLLTKRQNGEFFYKDIQANPYNTFDIPSSLLKDFHPSNVEDMVWLSKCIQNKKEQKEKKVEKKIGSYWKIKLPYDIHYRDGEEYKKGEELFVKVAIKNSFAKRKTKTFIISEKNNKGEFYQTFRSIRGSTFDECEKVFIKKFVEQTF